MMRACLAAVVCLGCLLPTDGFLQGPLATKGASMPGSLAFSSRARGGRLVTSGDKIKGLRGLAKCRLGLRMVKAEDGDGNGGIAAKRKEASSDEVSEPGVVADGAETAEQGLGESAKDLGGGPGARDKIEPVLSPDPLASALALALIGGGIAAANGAIPEVSGPIADALSALGGGVPFS
jgi:hypothetical protein